MPGYVRSMTSFESGRAQLIADLVPLLPAEVRAELRQALGEELLVSRPAAIRGARLGLLRRILAERTGEVPQVRLYNQRRAQAAALGEDWPSASALSDHFGGWDHAVVAAARLEFAGRSHITDKQVREPRVTHTVTTALDAVDACRDFYGGAWPFPEQFYRWRTLSRDLARKCRKPMPAIPDRKVLRRLFPARGFEEMLARAQERQGLAKQEVAA